MWLFRVSGTNTLMHDNLIYEYLEWLDCLFDWRIDCPYHWFSRLSPYVSKQHHECLQDGHVSKPSSFQIDFGPGDSEDCFRKIWWWGKIASFYHGCYLNILPFKKGNIENRLTYMYRQRRWGYPCYWMLLKHHETSLGTATEMHRVSQPLLEQLMVKSNFTSGISTWFGSRETQEAKDQFHHEFCHEDSGW